MSTITAVRKNGVAAIAADSVTTSNTIRESARYVVNHHKILRLGDSFLAVTGNSSLKLALRDFFDRTTEELPLDGVKEIFRTWLTIHAALKDEYFLNPEEEDHSSVESSQMDVLIAGPRGIFGVGSDRTVQEFTRFYASGQGSELALGAMYVAYDLPNLSAEEVARLGVEAAAEFDDSTGLPIISYTVELIEGGK